MTGLRRPPSFDLTVGSRRRHGDRALTAFAAAAVLVAAIAGWAAGYYLGHADGKQAARDLAALDARHRDLQATLEHLEQDLTDARVGQRVAAGFDEQMRIALAEKTARIGVLEDEVRLYRNLMTPGDGSEVRIAGLELSERLDRRGVRFRLLLVQSADQREYVSGRVELVVVGERNGEAAVLEGRFFDGGSDRPLEFRFRYLQDLTGEIELPEGFRPEAVQVVVRGEGREEFELERTFSWQIQEV